MLVSTCDLSTDRILSIREILNSVVVHVVEAMHSIIVHKEACCNASVQDAHMGAQSGHLGNQNDFMRFHILMFI